MLLKGIEKRTLSDTTKWKIKGILQYAPQGSIKKIHVLWLINYSKKINDKNKGYLHYLFLTDKSGNLLHVQNMTMIFYITIKNHVLKNNQLDWKLDWKSIRSDLLSVKIDNTQLYFNH